MLTKHEVYKVDEKYYDRYSAIKLTTTSTENLLTGKIFSSRRIEPNGEPTKREYLEQLVAFKKGVKVELPYTCEVGYDRFADDELVKWFEGQLNATTNRSKGIIEVDAEDLELGEDA